MLLANLLVTILNRNTIIPPDKQPWEKGNSWLIKSSIVTPTIEVTRVYYKSGFSNENISTGISDVTISVIKI